MEYWGYVRVSVSKEEQAAGWADQIATLEAMGCTKLYREEESTRNTRPVFERMQKEAMLHAKKTGETVCLVASKLDRAFRDLTAADAAINDMPDSGVVWLLPDVSDKPLNPADAGQMLLMRLLGSVAQFERDRLAERRAVGIAKAKAEGRYKGRKATARAKTDDVLAWKAKGLKANEIARMTGIGVASVYRILKDAA